MVLPATLFEELGFNYIGPLDGHDVSALVATLRNLKSLRGRAVAACRDAPGQGLRAVPSDPITPGAVDPASAERTASREIPPYLHPGLRASGCATWRRPIRASSASRRRPPEDSGLLEFAKRFPDRFFDVGIAQQHAVTFAAGLATEGLRPVVAIGSTFLQRTYDQLIHDVALQKLPVVFAVDRAGLVGGDGATHQGSYDLSLPAMHPQPDGHGARRTRTSAVRCSTRRAR